MANNYGKKKLTLAKLHTFAHKTQPDGQRSVAPPWYRCGGSLAPFPAGVKQEKSTRVTGAGLTATSQGPGPHLLPGRWSPPALPR